MKCKVVLSEKIFDGELMGLFQYSEVVGPSPMIGGHAGGVVAHPVAIVKVGELLKQVRVSSVRFEDDKTKGYTASAEDFVKQNEFVNEVMERLKKHVMTNEAIRKYM